MITKAYINNERLDLFSEENIFVKSSITDANDVTKNSGDYSKSFTVPATSNNNRIFKHYYDATIDNTFDARVKVDGHITLDGVPFKTGQWKLFKVSVKKGKPSSYTISFFGRLVSLKSKFKNDELSVLDFSALNHSYEYANVKQGLTSSLFDGKIIYNLLARKQYYYNSNSNDNVNIDTLANIGYNGASAGVVWSELQPSIKLIEVIKAIETKYDIYFSRDFFGRMEFDNLYMWLNADKDSQAGGGVQRIDWNTGDNNFINFTTDVGTFVTQMNAFPMVRYKLSTNVTPSAGYENVPYRIVGFVDGEQTSVTECVGQGVRNTTIQESEETTFNVYYEIHCDEEFKYTAGIYQTEIIRTASATDPFFETTTNNYFTGATENTISSSSDIDRIMPRIKTIDFLKGLFQMFKLVVIPINERDVYVNTLNDYYANGNLYDITKYVDFESFEVERGDLLNEISFKFADTETILNKEFTNITGQSYGDEELLLEDENGEPLDGNTLSMQLPFEQVVYERLPDINDNTQTNIMYGAIINEDLEPTTLKPHIFYNVPTQIGSKTIGFKNSGGAVEELTGVINTPSHTIDFTNKLYSTVFSSEYSNWDGVQIDNTLYSNYYKDYILSIFNIKRRNFKYKAILPLHLQTSIQLNDVLQIKGNYYRIDNYVINLLTGETTLDLINSFDIDISNFGVNQTVFFIDSNSQRLSAYVNNKNNDVFDVYDSESWINVSLNGNVIYLDVDANNTNDLRIGKVVFGDVRTDYDFTLTVYQEAGIITVDNNIITVDSDIITVDNG